MIENKYAALFEDEDDIFGGTPQSKYWDIANIANEEIVSDELDKVFEKYAVMEMLLANERPEGHDLLRELAGYRFENSMEIEQKKKGLYIEFTGDIVCRLDS